MKKRILACLLTAMLISSVLPVQAAETSFSTDIVSGSWVCVDEALRIVATMPDAENAASISAYINGSENAAASSESGTLVIPENTLLPGDNTVSFKAVDANGNQLGEAQSITINGFKPLNSTVISETNFNNVTDAYNKSYEATLASDGWTYNDYTAQTETSYLSPEVLYGCDSMEWTDGCAVSRLPHSAESSDMYLNITTTSQSNVEFKLASKPHSYPGDIVKISMDILNNDTAVRTAGTNSCVEDTRNEYKVNPYSNIANNGWHHVVCYFDPNKNTGTTYLYDNNGKLLGNTVSDWTTDEEYNGVYLNGENYSFGFKVGVKKDKTVGFDNIKFESLSLGHYDDFSVTMSETKTEGTYVDSAAMTVIAYGEGAKVYIDGVTATADLTDGATKVYYIDGSVYEYGRKNIRVDYKRVNEFESVVYENLLLKRSTEANGNYVNYLTTTQDASNKWIAIEHNILSNSDMSGPVRMKLGVQKKLADSPKLIVWENGIIVSDNYNVTWKNGGLAYEISNKSMDIDDFKANSYYKISVENHSIYFYTPGNSGAYLNLYDAQLTDGSFSVMVEKAASAALANPVKLIVAVYNGDELVKVLTKDLEIAKGVDATGVNLSFTGNATRAKAFIFDGLDSITPLTADIEAK